MNKIYKVIWSKVKNQYVVVSELAHSNGKQSRTSRNSIRSRIAALVVCGAIAAFGVFSAVPNSAYAATAAETTSGQYIAVALADTNEEDVAGQWTNRNSTKFGNDYEWSSTKHRWVECGDTRTFNDATGASHTYTKQTINNKTYWVRDGYSISAEEGNRFTAYDEHRKPIAPENTYIIDSQKSNGADDVGLISSSQVVISDDSKHTTLTGNPLNNIEPGIYGGASNGGGTEVPVDYHYYIDNNGKGWVNIGKQDWDNFTNPSSGKGYFQEVYAQKDGSYNTKEDGSGISVSSEYLYAIDKTSTGSSEKSDVKLGAFFNSNGTLYTGNVYGNNNEVLMTGVENGTYYSYWGTKINDLNTSLSEMTVGDLNRIVGGINDTIYTAQGDDIKQVSVQKSQDNNGGTIDLIRRGDWNGTAYEETDPIPGTITVTSEGGIDDNDVAIKFANDQGSFTVDAGSKVEGLKDEATAKDGDTLTGIKINGVEYDLSQGKTYSPGQGIAINGDDNKISVNAGNGLEFTSQEDGEKLKVNANEDKGITVDSSGVAVNAGEGLAFGTDQTDKGQLKVNVGEGLSINGSNQIVNNLKVAKPDDSENKHDNGGNWTVTDSKANITLTNTTLSSSVDKQPITGENVAGSGYGNTYTISDTDGNTATLSDVASAATLKNIDVNKIGNLKYGNTTNIVTNNTTVTEAIGDLDNAVSKGWTAQVGDSSINVTPKDGKNTLSFAGDNNITVSADENTSTIQVGLNNDVYLGGNNTAENSNITLDGTNGVIEVGSTIALDGRDGKAVIGSINIETVYDEATGKPSSTISGLANTTWDADLAAQGGYANSNKAATEAQIQSAVNQSGWTASTNKNVEGLAAKTDITNGDTVDFSNTDGNISVSQTAVTENGTVTGTDIKFDLNDNISLGDGKITLNGAPAEGEDLLNVDNKLVVAQDGTTTIAVNDGTVMGNNTTVTIGSDGVTFAGYDKGSTIIDGQTIQAGGVFINDGGNGQITRLTNTTLDDPTFATVGRAATEEQLQLATDAATTTVTEGKNIDVTSTVDKEDGHTNYEVKLQDNVVLGDNKITLNGNPGEGEDLLNVDNALVVGQDGTTTIAADNAETMGVDTRVTVNTDGVTFEGLENGSTIIDGQTIQAGGVFINDGGNGQITRLTNTTLNDPTFATVGRAATEEQLQLATDAATTTVTEGKNIDVTSTVDKEDGHTNYEVKLQDNVVLGDNKITLNGNPGEGEDLLNVDNALVVGQDGTTTIAADNAETMGVDTRVTVNTDGVTFEGLENGSTIIDGQTIQAGGVFINDGGNGQITRLTNTTLDDPTFATVGRAATEEQLQLATDAATTTVSEGKNIDVTSTVDEEDGHTDYEVSLQDNVSLGDGKITLNGAPAEGDDLLNVDNAFVVGQDGTTTITADDAGTMGADTKVTVGTDGVKFEGLENGTTTIDGQTIQAGGVFINDGGNGQITRLTNTTLDDPTFATVGRAATEEQLKQAAAASKTTLSDGVNTTVTSNDNTPDGHVDYQVNLNDNVYLGGNNKPGSSNIELDGENGTIQVGSNIILDSKEARAIIGGVDISTTFDDIGKKSSTITGLSNTTWDTDKVVIDRAATEGQLQMVSDKVTAGWTATDDAGNKINVNPETRPTLNFASGKNITVSANEDSGEVEVSLNDNINLNDRVYINGDPEEGNNTIVDIKSGNTSKEESIFAVEDKGNGSISIGGIDITNVDGPYLAVGDGKLKFYKDGGLSTGNATGTFSVRPDGDLEISGKNSSFDVDAETGNINAENNSGSSIKMDGNGTTIAVNDGTVMGNNTTMTVNKDGVAFSAYGNGTTVIDGQTIYAGGVVINNNGSGTINGLTNTTWDDELAKQVANSEELQGTAATQGQLQQAVNEVAEVANAGWNAKAGGNTINVKPNETLNFEGDGNITVSATSGTSSELKFGLNHNITLDNVKDKNTMLVINTDGREGYIPDNYKDSNEDAEDFIRKHGGFAIYYANPSLTTGDMTGTFGVTTDGVVHAKDVISYYSASSGSQSDVIRYSLNDVGDIVTQISHAVFDEGVGKTGMEYTLISDFEDEADKDSPFDAKEGKTRTIGLAVRQDGAVIVGAVVNDEGISRDRGIRINAETKTTYDKNGNEVTNNIATITGLENTEWKPPTPVATFAANDGSATVTSRAATESQLNDLYSAVAAYDVNVDGTIDYSHIALAGTPYGASRSGNGTPTGGTSITNVAYASGKDGSEAVNVDYLNDAINNAVKDGGAISDSDRHLQEGTYHVNDQGKVELIVADEKGENQSTVTIDNIANKNDITNLDNKIDNTFNDLNDKINNIDNVETDVKGGNINEDGTISLKTENEDGTTTNVTLKGQLTDSGVVQEGTSFDKETGTITITSQDKYSGETSSVKVEGIASTEVVGATNKEDLATAYKDADKDGNATTEYITDSESMVEADVALDHAIQDVAGTSYANDMVLSNRIDSVEKRLGNVEERIDKVGAMAAAIANLRTMGFDPEAPTEIAIGVGQYKSETGIAIGVFHYPNQDFMLSASLSSSGDELMGGIGATWKLGRKSAAERAKDEEARHLEQAEEMKKLAQQEKVKAQAQRHAKLLAERQQASQKNA